MTHQYSIAPEVFEKYKGYQRGVVLAFGVANGPSPDELADLLRRAEDEARGALDLERLAEHPKMASWREAYRAFGAKPAKFRPSMEAMLRRVLKGQPLPSISRLVDIGNIISLRCLMPAGGHAIDQLGGDISLKPAVGDEVFVAFGSDQTENPEPGEIVFVEGQTVLTRRWTWRQANHTLVVPETTALLFNLDGLPPVGLAEIEAAAAELISLVEKFCGGRCRLEILSPENPSLALAE